MLTPLLDRPARLVAAICLTLVGLAACDLGEETGPQPRPGTTAAGPPPTPSLPCPEQSAVLDEPGAPNLSGDVDGDGAPDRVLLAEAVAGRECPEVLLVESETSIDFAEVTDALDGSGSVRLVMLAEVDGRPGLEVVVGLGAGASTEFFGVFTLDRSLLRLGVEGARFGDAFPSGGSVGHLDASDCAGPGRVVISNATPVGSDRYEVERRFFEFDRGSMRRTGSSTTKVDSSDLASIEEFTATPFGSCPTV